MRIVVSLFGAFFGCIAGLIIGAVAGACMVAAVLLAMGDSHPMASMDSAYAARPMGWPALVLITTYVVSAVLCAAWCYLKAGRLALRLQSLPSLDRRTHKAKVLTRWQALTRVKKALLVLLYVLMAFVTVPFMVYYQQTIDQGSRTPTAERPVSINDHGHEVYVTSAQSRVIHGGNFAMVAVGLGAMGSMFYLLGVSSLVGQGFRSGTRRDGRDR